MQVHASTSTCNVRHGSTCEHIQAVLDGLTCEHCATCNMGNGSACKHMQPVAVLLPSQHTRCPILMATLRQVVPCMQACKQAYPSAPAESHQIKCCLHVRWCIWRGGVGSGWSWERERSLVSEGCAVQRSTVQFAVCAMDPLLPFRH